MSVNRRLRLTTLTIAMATVLLAPAAHGGMITVTTDNDADDGTDGDCSLREAMQAAFSSADYHECTHSGGTGAPHVIQFSSSFTITVGSTPFPEVVNEVAVDGSGQSVIIDGDDANRPFNVDEGDLTLMSLMVQNCGGNGGAGGAVLVDNSDGSLAALDVTFMGNAATQGSASQT